MVEKRTMFSHSYHTQEDPDRVSGISIIKIRDQDAFVRTSVTCENTYDFTDFDTKNKHSDSVHLVCLRVQSFVALFLFVFLITW